MSFKISITCDGLAKVTPMSNLELHNLQMFCIVKNIEYLIWDNELFIRPIDQDLLTDYKPAPIFNQFKTAHA